VRSGTIKKRKSFVPETIKKRLESYPGWSDLVRLRKKRAQWVSSHFAKVNMLVTATASFPNVSLQRDGDTPTATGRL